MPFDFDFQLELLIEMKCRNKEFQRNLRLYLDYKININMFLWNKLFKLSGNFMIFKAYNYYIFCVFQN